MINKRFMLEVSLDVEVGDLVPLFKTILEDETDLTVTITELAPDNGGAKSAGKPELGTMAVCVKCNQEVVYKVDFCDVDKEVELSWWALVDPDGDEDPFLCRPVGPAPLMMHSVDLGVEQSDDKDNLTNNQAELVELIEEDNL